jgi:hypothetical protein
MSLVGNGARIDLLMQVAKPLFAQYSAGVQAAALSDLMARVLASIDPEHRATALRGHLQLMHRLIPLHIPAKRRQEEELS